MRWAEQQRIDWIGKRIHEHEKINRKDIIDQFRVSVPQAYKDIKTFIGLNPGVLRYDLEEKTYRLAETQLSMSRDLDQYPCLGSAGSLNVLAVGLARR